MSHHRFPVSRLAYVGFSFVAAQAVALLVPVVGLLEMARSEESANPPAAVERFQRNATSQQPSVPQTSHQTDFDNPVVAPVPFVKSQQGTNALSHKLNWTTLFDGKSLDGWKITKFGGEGDVFVKNGRLVLGLGNDMTGVTWTRKTPKINYEVELEAMRVIGTDFFCGLTFPVGKDPCSLIVGGWGGGVCGLSSINGMDASENATTSYREFEKGRWYRVRLRVKANRIQAWIDNKEIVNQDLTNKKLSIRSEVELSKPFGFSTCQTTGALRKIRIRKLTAKEIAAKPSAPKSE
jgi:hypothetical protein